ncbi:MAG: FAD-dependent oxidoreductase [Deltaproteobacteria bacterium]|nr:FAD-dependent oxidoreductase [Deltaproteobacteria bacterium]
MNDDERKTISYWWTTRDYTPNPPVEGEVEVDVAVIGGGYTGLSTAFHLRQADPSLDVLVLEQETVGFGASGRNAGFGMTLFGLTLAMTKLLHGRDAAVAAHHYMEKSVDYLWQMIQEHDLDCDAERSGFLRAATTPKYAKRIQHEVELAQKLGLEGIEWIDAAAMRSRADSKHFLGAWWEPRCVLLNPAKLAWELKRIAEAAGARIAEETPVSEIKREKKGGHYVITTPAGTVRARKIAIATNAFQTHFGGMQRKQIPVYTDIVLSEPLGDKLHQIGWKGREGIEDARNLIHYFRLTADDRLLMGGGNVRLSYGSNISPERDRDQNAAAHLQNFARQLFPVLEDVEFTHNWGGPVSVTVDMCPALGYVGKDKSAVYSYGCIGHGVSMTQYNGWALADLLLEKETERTEPFFVNGWTPPWPVEPFRMVLAAGIRGALSIEDSVHERGRLEY